MPTVVDAVYSLSSGTPCLLPLYPTVSAGFPSPADDYSEDELDLSAYLIERPAATFMVRAAGDSMVDAGIRSGDLLIVDKSLTPRDGDIVIAAVDGQFMVKRFRQNGPDLQLVAESRSHPAIKLDPMSDVEIWGVVLHVIHSTRRRR